MQERIVGLNKQDGKVGLNKHWEGTVGIYYKQEQIVGLNKQDGTEGLNKQEWTAGRNSGTN